MGGEEKSRDQKGGSNRHPHNLISTMRKGGFCEESGGT